MATGGFQELIVWQKAMKLAGDIYQITGKFPPDERFNLTSQLRRAAVSVPSNIAEGHGRRTHGEYCQFLGISLGSVREIQTCLLLSKSFGYLDDVEELNDLCEEVAKMLYGIQRKLNPRGQQ